MTRIDKFFADADAPPLHLIEAEFDSWCAGLCGEDIERGDQIVFSHEHDGFVHAHCHEDYDEVLR